MPRATYANVRRHLGKRFSLSATSTGRRSGQRWSEGAQVRSSHIDGVVVDYLESHAALQSDGSLRKDKLAEMRAYLAEKYAVTDHWANDGRMIISDKAGE